MGIVSGIAVFFMIWWTLLFAVLPWGNQPAPKSEKVKGQADSAPHRSRLKQKFLINTVLTALVWIVIYLLVELNIFSFSEWAAQQPL